MFNKILASSLVMLGVGFGGAASAQSTWNMTGGCSQNASYSGNFGNSYACTQDSGVAATATVSGWSSGRSNEAGGNLSYSLSGSGWASAYLSDNGGSGWGVVSRTEANVANGLNVGSPNHSTDNFALAGIFDFVMVKFDVAQVLTKVGAGWGASDSDMTLMRWTGGSDPTTSDGMRTGGGSRANLVSTIGSGGWELVGNYSNICNVSYGSCTNNAISTGTATASSYWLIAAYNTTMGGSPGPFSSQIDDGFKLNYLQTAAYTCPGGGSAGPGGTCQTVTTGVPEPDSLALAGLAAFAGFVVRRRRRNKG